MNKEWLDILLDLSYISGTIDGISNAVREEYQEELLNGAEQIQKVIGRIQKQLQSSLLVMNDQTVINGIDKDTLVKAGLLYSDPQPILKEAE